MVRKFGSTHVTRRASCLLASSFFLLWAFTFFQQVYISIYFDSNKFLWFIWIFYNIFLHKLSFLTIVLFKYRHNVDTLYVTRAQRSSTDTMAGTAVKLSFEDNHVSNFADNLFFFLQVPGKSHHIRIMKLCNLLKLYICISQQSISPYFLCCFCYDCKFYLNK